MSYKEMVGSIYLFLISHFCTLLSVCSGLCLRNRVFSQKELLDKSFIFKLLLKVFFFFTIFRLLRPLKVLLIFWEKYKISSYDLLDLQFTPRGIKTTQKSLWYVKETI
jgi:hypothetical protein